MPFSSADGFKEKNGVLEYDGQELEQSYNEDRSLEFQSKTTFDFDTPLRQQLKFGFAALNKSRDSKRTYQEFDNDGQLTDLTSDADQYHISEDYFSAFVQDQIWINEQSSVLPGIRAEHLRRSSRDGGSLSDSRSRTDFNPSLHFLYQVKENLAFRLAFSRSLNHPQFDQLSPFQRINDEDEEVNIGNPDLDPATSWNIDLGADWQKGSLFLGANIFYKKISDVIQSERVGTQEIGGTDYNLYQSNNVGDGWLKGIEFDQRYQFSSSKLSSLRGLELWANQSIYSSRLRFENGGSGSFEEQPKFILNLGADYTFEKTHTRLSVSGNYVSNFTWQESDGTQVGYASEWIVNASVHQKLGENLEAFVEAANLFNEERLEQEISPKGEFRNEYITSGRVLLAGLNYTF